MYVSMRQSISLLYFSSYKAFNIPSHPLNFIKIPSSQKYFLRQRNLFIWTLSPIANTKTKFKDKKAKRMDLTLVHLPKTDNKKGSQTRRKAKAWNITKQGKDQEETWIEEETQIEEKLQNTKISNIWREIGAWNIMKIGHKTLKTTKFPSQQFQKQIRKSQRAHRAQIKKQHEFEEKITQ